MTVKAKNYQFLYCEVWLERQKRAALLTKSFIYNHSISDVVHGLWNTRQRDFVTVKSKIINFYIVKYGYKGRKEQLI